MANPDLKTILLEDAFKEIKDICVSCQNDSDISDIEIKNLLMSLAKLWEAKEDNNKFGFL